MLVGHSWVPCQRTGFSQHSNNFYRSSQQTDSPESHLLDFAQYTNAHYGEFFKQNGDHFVFIHALVGGEINSTIQLCSVKVYPLFSCHPRSLFQKKITRSGMLQLLCSSRCASAIPNFWDHVFKSKTSLPKETLIRDLCQHGTNEILNHFEKVSKLLLYHFPREISCLIRRYVEWTITLQQFQYFFAHLIQSYKIFQHVSREQVECAWPGDYTRFYSVLDEWFRTYKYARENSAVMVMDHENHFNHLNWGPPHYSSTGYLYFSYKFPITEEGFWIEMVGREKKKGMHINNLQVLVRRTRDPLSFSLLRNVRFQDELDDAIREWIPLVGIPFLQTGDTSHLNKSWDWHWLSGIRSKKADPMQHSWDASAYLSIPSQKQSQVKSEE